MDPDTAILEIEDAMSKCVDYLIHEFAGVRTGKASPALIDNLDVHVHAYGAVSKLKSLAVISSPEPRMLVVQPFDPSTTRDIEKAIRESKLGLNPAAADRSIRVPIPELSEERRKDMVKLIKQLAEEAKVRLRAARKDPNAVRYETVTFQECLTKRLNVMDATAFSLCMDNHVPIIIFDLGPKGNLSHALRGLPIGTLVHGE